jgi:CDP-diacylglycerol---glycerol-3-phosphate 3-phosphatidyltransferase
MKLNAPNVLTMMRILAVPALVAILLTRFEGREIAGFSIFLLASLTDMVDGFLARKNKEVTVFGQLLDPTADKLLIASVLICLVERGVVPAWMAVIIIGREIAVTGFRAIASSRGHHIPAFPLGKIKMVLEIVTLCLLILGPVLLGRFYSLAQVGLWLTIVVAIASAAEYYIRFGPVVLSKDI